MDEQVFHYTDKAGWNGIRSQRDWVFRASTPPGEHQEGAYFTKLPPSTQRGNLAKALRTPRAKREFVFMFVGTEGLEPATYLGSRGHHVLWSSVEYRVERLRQRFDGSVDDWGAA